MDHPDSNILDNVSFADHSVPDFKLNLSNLDGNRTKRDITRLWTPSSTPNGTMDGHLAFSC